MQNDSTLLIIAGAVIAVFLITRFLLALRR